MSGPVVALSVVGSVSHSPLVGSPVAMALALAAFSILPFVLLLLTSFVKISVVLSIAKGAIGAPQVPPNQVITGLALILTLFVMAPTGERMYRAAEPALAQGAGADLMSAAGFGAVAAAGDRAKEPLRDFLLKHTSPRDRGVFHQLAFRLRTPAERAEIGDRDLLV